MVRHFTQVLKDWENSFLWITSKIKENAKNNYFQTEKITKQVDIKKINTLGALKKTDYTPQGIKDELRKNLVHKLQSDEKVFPDIIGFDDTVLPDVERAVLSKHNILLLGLRGQAKTRIARLLVNLLDEFVPVLTGSELMDDPLNPISRQGKDIIAEKGDEAPIHWIHRSERYVEKLATPDVSVADLIGDVDPIKAATLKLPYSDERVIHYGLVPRAHRSIFVINELPDLQARIQVSLFNILQEGDLQIRGFKLRLPLDVQFVFTANPEDYTNRGSIITPLKDRIESQILTHYPKTIEISKSITQQESKKISGQEDVIIPPVMEDLIEMIAFEARKSELIDDKSGVSARLSISAFELLRSAAERRMLMHHATSTQARITDLWGIIPAITGKVELVYEGEQEGPYAVALILFSDAIADLFLQFFPKPDEYDKAEENDPYGVIRAWFSGGHQVDLQNDSSDEEFRAELDKISGLEAIVDGYNVPDQWKYFFKELIIFGLSEYEVLNKNILEKKLNFNDPFASMFDDLNSDN
jgi:magnesium chelatase subunit I